MAKARKARNQGQNQEQPVNAEIQRAAERIGYSPAQAVAEHGLVLLRATDRVGALLASLTERHTRRLQPETFLDCIEDQVTELHLLLWQARWEMNLGGGDRVAMTEESDPLGGEGGAP